MIPEAAVEAAARASFQFMEDRPWKAVDPDEVDFFRDAARKALEAAAPHMLNLAKCEALDANLEIQRLREELVELAKEFDTAEGGTLAYTATIEGRYAMRKNAHDQLLHIVAGIGRHAP